MPSEKKFHGWTRFGAPSGPGTIPPLRSISGPLPVPSSKNSNTSGDPIGTAADVAVLPADALGWHAALRPLLLARLREAHRPETALFDRQLRDGRWDETLGTEEITSSAIALIGMRRAAVDPAELGVDVAATLAAMARRTKGHADEGPLGLVAWASAEWSDRPFQQVVADCGVPARDGDELLDGLTTMELAWLVSGLVHGCHRRGDDSARRLLAPARERLLRRLDPSTRLFMHATAEGGPIDRMRRHVANFADQIYPVQALAFVATLEGDRAALAAAEACAARLVELQGPLGQWLWHYDAQRGIAVQAYPIYSVHQHGMAPMALHAVRCAGGSDRAAAAELGRRWLDVNELGRSMVDLTAGTIWRSLELAEPALKRIGRKFLSAVGGAPPSRPIATARQVALNLETRPYEWAWCLYAGAILAAPAGDGHLV